MNHMAKEDERSRSRSKEKRPKKHKKEKKRKRKHSSDEDTGGEGGDTPERESRKEERAIPGLAKYESEGEEGEIERKRGRSRSREKRDRSRSREKRDRSKERRDRSRSRDRKDRSRSRERRRDEKSRKRSRSRERGGGKEEKVRKEEKGKEQEPGEIGGEGSQQVLSLSIDETNKLRAKLGLKPLNVNKAEAEETAEEKKQPGVLIPGDRDRTRHLAPEHWGEKARTKKLAERIAEKRDQRKVRGKLDRIKGLGEESSDEDDAGKWIEKQRRKVGAKELEELDNEFGVEALVSNSLKEDRQTEYDRKNLKGLKVGHSAGAFGEKSTILTLADGDILDEKYVDTLTNVNIEDDERTKKSHQNVKDFKEGYKAYDSEVIDEMTGEVQKKELLYQYKESLEGEKKESFTLEAEGEFSEEVKRERELAKIRYKLKLQNTTSLDMPAPQLARDFYTNEEMKEKASVKKEKNKEGVRKSKMLKADDLLAMSSEAGAQEPVRRRRERPAEDQSLPDGRLPQPMDIDDGEGLAGDVPNAAPLDLDPEPVIPRALLIARKLKAKQGKVDESSVDKVAEKVLARKDDDAAANGYEGGVELVLDQTAEFCRGLGEVGHWQDMQSGLSGGTVDKELLDFEAGLEQEAGARMRSAVEWSKQMDLDDEEKA